MREYRQTYGPEMVVIIFFEIFSKNFSECDKFSSLNLEILTRCRSRLHHWLQLLSNAASHTTVYGKFLSKPLLSTKEPSHASIQITASSWWPSFKCAPALWQHTSGEGRLTYTHVISYCLKSAPKRFFHLAWHSLGQLAQGALNLRAGP